jgi:hypothetical protein
MQTLRKEPMIVPKRKTAMFRKIKGKVIGHSSLVVGFSPSRLERFQVIREASLKITRSKRSSFSRL